MKEYFIRAFVATVAFIIVYLLLDLVFRHAHSFQEYAVEAVIFGRPVWIV